MATYDSIHTGEQVDNAVDIVLGNKSKGSVTQPIYLDANGAAQNVNVDANPTDSSANLVQSGGVFTQLSTKYAKADISTDPNLGTSNTVIPSQGAVKSYVDTKLATKQDVVVAGDGIVKEGNTLSISTDNDFMTVGKLDNKWSHFVSGLDMGYGTETIEKMENAKRSSFDLSKFTVVGSPIVTSDGIASGFSSSSNKIKTIKASELLNKSWTIKTKVNGNGNSIIMPISFADSWSNMCSNIVSAYSKNNIYMNIKSGDSEESYQLAFNNTYSFLNFNHLSEDIDVSLSFDISTGTYTLRIEPVDGNWTALTKTYTPTTTNKQLYEITSTNNYIYFCSAVQGDCIWNANATYDLKQFSITVDGVEVFSGNKTGIDTVKPDDYTSNGSSISSLITNDGILGYNLADSNTNYIESPSITLGNNFDIYVRYKLISVPAGFRIFGENSGTSILRGFIGNYSLALNFTASDDSTISMPNISITEAQVGQWCTLKFSFDGTKYVATIYNENGASIGTATLTSSLLPKYTKFNTQGGSTSANANYQIDLNELKIYVNGDLAWQPCLKIPYTQTKDGKKIVDYNYKSRVEDEYTQAGFTPYYTLSDTDYTMATVKESAIVDSYDNGMNKWTKLANLTCKQQGSCTSGTAVTFTKPYIDTNYALSVPYSAKTKTGFTPSATGDWIANGKVNLNA